METDKYLLSASGNGKMEFPTRIFDCDQRDAGGDRNDRRVMQWTCRLY